MGWSPAFGPSSPSEDRLMADSSRVPEPSSKENPIMQRTTVKRRQADGLTCSLNVRRELESGGYSYFSGNDVRVPPELAGAAERLAGEFDGLPADPYCGDGTRRR